ncbi:Variant-specific surface protein [Giardia duodenalis]|uniref:Variant-specific surface protein n=1 Tax=Giardia intestinalis TaxID=5741 RepID=V6U2L1_GIAIN|nr:Variant-specific surface protein [Giardia intestinalis]
MRLKVVRRVLWCDSQLGHPWSVEGHTMSSQANDSTQSPHHRMQGSHSEKASGVARPAGCLICQGSDRTQQLATEHPISQQPFHPSSDMAPAPSLGGCYSAGAAPGSSVCREARDGACARHAEGVRSVQTAETCTTGAEIGKCAPNHCNVQIGDSVYCSQCSNGGSDASSPAPTNGVCSADNNECSAKAEGRCTTCDHASFLFQGGCYSKGAAPGNTMCTQAANGICSAAVAGYFVPPTDDRDNAHQSVIPCGDVEEITVKNDHKYKGVAHCTQCSTPATAADTTNAKAATCTACEDGYFVASAACTACDEQCATCEGTNSDSKCKSCKEGYFLGATSGGQGKCIQCNNLEDQSWKGVQNCAKCTSSKTSGTPATCTECAENYYLRTDGSTTSCVSAADCNNGFFPTTDSNNKKVCVKCSDNNNGGIANCAKCSLKASPARAGAAVTCTECEDGYFVAQGGAACTACQDENCTTCAAEGTEKCSKCKATNTAGAKLYLKTVSSGSIGTCVEASGCGSGFFPKADDKAGNKCTACGSASDGGIADCKTCSKDLGALKCSACTTEGKKPNTTGAACVACSITDCASCDKENVCAVCDNGKYLTPTGQCVDSCAKLGGYYKDNNNVCKPCSPECASCSTAGADKCLSCPAGKVLKYTDETKPSDGSCVDECKTGAGGCVDCGAVIGGSKYCSRCSDTNQAPLNGNCAANTARIQFCTQIDGGACTQCANGYFLLDGGCYETGRQPGKSVCTTANNGQCQTCVNGQSPSSGVCPACPAGCSTCSNTNTCTACLAGYYLSSSKCVKCSENSNNIQGVPNCVSCAAPSGSGPVTCYVTQTPAVDPADPSTNKSGLSSGAIAGISVAAVVACSVPLTGYLPLHSKQSEQFQRC